MSAPGPAPRRGLEESAFLLLVAATSVAFVWILWPFSGAILWGTALAIVFMPLYRELLRSLGQRRTVAALATMVVILVIVIIPVTLVVVLLVEEAVGLYARVQTGELDFGRYFQQVVDALPDRLIELVNRFGPTDLAAVQERLSAAVAAILRFLGAQAINLGQHTLRFVLSAFVMLYLLFFLLRDGEALAGRIKRAMPLRPDLRESLAARFTTVIRATIKGTLVVALVQGALGGLAFWVLGIQAAALWGALMALLALLPAVGPALVWLPVAVYLAAAGMVWRGIGLALFGILVIGLVDNVLRPMLVGRDTRMPDYVVLVSTLGGLAVFGLNGFIIGPVIAAMFISVWDIFSSRRATAAEVPAP